jgi:hypothetical protein
MRKDKNMEQANTTTQGVLHYVELDTSTLDDVELLSFLGYWSITLEVVVAQGSFNGGWPVIRYTGQLSALRQLVRTYWEEDADVFTYTERS